MPGINNTLASQGTGVYQHKVLDCISYFGQECIKNNLVPKLAKIKMRDTSPATKLLLRKPNYVHKIVDGGKVQLV
jgi:hypothetical protein